MSRNGSAITGYKIFNVSSFVLIIIIVIITTFVPWHHYALSNEWIQINPSVFTEKGEVAISFQDAVFNEGVLYVITSDVEGITDPVESPDRATCLWTSLVAKDPNIWADESAQRWKVSGVFSARNVRLDELLDVSSSPGNAGAGFIYCSIYDRDFSLCEVYELLSSGSKKEIFIGSGYNNLQKWRVDSAGAFRNRLYLGIYEEDYGCRLRYGDLDGAEVNDNVPSEGLYLNDPNVIKVNFVEKIGETLFVGVRQRWPRAVLYYTPYGEFWRSFDETDFDVPVDLSNISENIVAYISMVEFMADAWLLTESRLGDKKEWMFWESEGTLSEISHWKGRFSSKDSLGPFNDSGLTGVTAPCAFDEYIYVGCLLKSGGQIWKNYRGKKWIKVPSTCFSLNNQLVAIFNNPQDMDYIFVGTRNRNGSQILTRLIPRIDLSGLPMDDRFTGPEKGKIYLDISTNWSDEDFWDNIDGTPTASIISFQAMDEEVTMFINPNKINQEVDSGLDLSPYIDKDGIYTIEFALTYGTQKEAVVKHLSLAWDSNAPTIPELLEEEKGIGDGSIGIGWKASRDGFQDAGFDDANFNESLKEYELECWRTDDPNKIEKRIIVSADRAGFRLDGLENFVSYKIHMRAWDKAGNVSGWSNEVEGTPQPTRGWTDLVSEQGGCFISSILSKGDEDADLKSGGKWLVGAKAGFYEPGSKDARLVYGRDEVWPLQLEVGWRHRKNLEAGLSMGYLEMKGMALLADSLKSSKNDPVTFRIIPSSLTLRWLPFQDAERFITPYLGAGLSVWWFQEDKIKKDDIDGFKYGYHGAAGVRVLLDRLDPFHATSIYKNYNVKNTFLILEVIYNQVDNFGESRLDLSGPFFQAGIFFLF